MKSKMKTKTKIFNEFSDDKKEIKITGYTFSPDMDHLLLIINNEHFTVLSTKQDDEDRYIITEDEITDPFGIFYEESLEELGIMTSNEIAHLHKIFKEQRKNDLYKEYLSLKAIFEPH